MRWGESRGTSKVPELVARLGTPAPGGQQAGSPGAGQAGPREEPASSRCCCCCGCEPLPDAAAGCGHGPCCPRCPRCPRCRLARSPGLGHATPPTATPPPAAAPPTPLRSARSAAPPCTRRSSCPPCRS